MTTCTKSLMQKACCLLWGGGGGLRPTKNCTGYFHILYYTFCKTPAPLPNFSGQICACGGIDNDLIKYNKCA